MSGCPDSFLASRLPSSSGRSWLASACFPHSSIVVSALFVLFAGLKGAVPILLGELLLTADVPDAERLYGIVVIVVIFSVLVQGSLVPPSRGDWECRCSPSGRSHGHVAVRLQAEPDTAHQVSVAAGSSSTAEPSRKSPSWPAISGSASWYAMGCCCRYTETPDCELVTW